MTMYNMIFGSTAHKLPTLAVCGIDPERVGRYRDVWLEKGGEDTVVLALYTRNGGGNRDWQAEPIEYLRSLPTFLDDEDDGFDPTYATFRFLIRPSDLHPDAQGAFDIPEEQRLDREEIWSAFQNIAVPRVDTTARWAEAIG